MRVYGVPADEVQRLQVLEMLEVCDLASSPELDRITRLAARHFRMPIVMVNLVDAALQRTPSAHGQVPLTLPREHSVCSHTILRDQSFVIQDARNDAQFADNPLVLMPEAGLLRRAPHPLPGGSSLGGLVPDRPRAARFHACRSDGSAGFCSAGGTVFPAGGGGSTRQPFGAPVRTHLCPGVGWHGVGVIGLVLATGEWTTGAVVGPIRRQPGGSPPGGSAFSS